MPAFFPSPKWFAAIPNRLAGQIGVIFLWEVVGVVVEALAHITSRLLALFRCSLSIKLPVNVCLAYRASKMRRGKCIQLFQTRTLWVGDRKNVRIRITEVPIIDVFWQGDFQGPENFVRITLDCTIFHNAAAQRVVLSLTKLSISRQGVAFFFSWFVSKSHHWPMIYAELFAFQKKGEDFWKIQRDRQGDKKKRKHQSEKKEDTKFCPLVNPCPTRCETLHVVTGV